MTNEKSLRIVHCFRAPVGGIFRHVRDLIDAQVAAGHKVGVICDASTGGAFEEALLDEMRGKLELGLERIAMQRQIGPGDAIAAFRTYKIIARMAPDVLHGHGAKGGTYARLFGSMLRRFTGTKVARFYSPHGGSLHFDPATMQGRVIFRVERLLERMTDRIIFVSAYEQGVYSKKIGVPRCGHALIYNGLKDSEFEPVPLDGDAADFLFIGEIRELKGPDIFVSALAQASAASGHTLKAVMIGDGNDRAAVVEQAQRDGLGPHIRFLMPMKAREAFRLAKVVVIPSLAEALPYIVLEALAAGRPVIASRVGGIPEILGETSRALVEPNAEALAKTMTRAISDLPAFKVLLPDIHALREKFGVANMAARLEAEYFSALATQD
ncbi:glycosyltransferase family 4 protein [Phyllobacterium sp. BT25]|uniref:Glycosyltransferase family 4 protein n=1 Tax=Phyllobacterium pellucidum TaxID=2740464 RepID=A0A849VKU7_9HYPH|nr:glycosyltransferase family 4 protein [Phyllobacterium pellucidum]NTS29916.1 glycosyltransferase family 4 protein [Phyllobacterium pellucidum]